MTDYRRVRRVNPIMDLRMPTLPVAKLVFWVCCALVLSGAIPDSSAADLLNTQSRKAHVLRVAGAQLPVRNDVQKNLEAITLNSAVDLTAKNAKITKTYSYAWIA